MNDTVNLNGFETDDIEYKIGFNNEDAITLAFELIVSRYSTKKGMSFEVPNALIKFIDKDCGVRWIFTCNPVKN